MKASEIRKKTEADILKNIGSLKEEAFQLKLKKNIGQLEKISDVKKAKKSIARYLTILGEMNNSKEASK